MNDWLVVLGWSCGNFAALAIAALTLYLLIERHSRRVSRYKQTCYVLGFLERFQPLQERLDALNEELGSLYEERSSERRDRRIDELRSEIKAFKNETEYRELWAYLFYTHVAQSWFNDNMPISTEERRKNIAWAIQWRKDEIARTYPLVSFSLS